jgi:FKBP-type peptidyl-prolyl cis-trans isomerase
MKTVFLTCVLALLVSSHVLQVMAQEQTPPPVTAGEQQVPQSNDKRTLEQKACYLLGYNFAMELTSQSVKLDLEQVNAGIKAALDNGKPDMSIEEMQAVMSAFAKEIQVRRQKALEEQSAKNMDAGMAFLKNYAATEGAIKLESGVIYRVLTAGTGTVNPTEVDQVKVHYTGKLTNGEIFDSSVGGEPATFPVGGLIRGMTEGLTKMKVGDKIEIVIPSELGYGASAPEDIGPNQVLVFEVELLEIVK